MSNLPYLPQLTRLPERVQLLNLTPRLTCFPIMFEPILGYYTGVEWGTYSEALWDELSSAG